MENKTYKIIKTTKNSEKTVNSIRSLALMITPATMVLLLTSPIIIMPASVWAEIFLGTSGVDTVVGTENDDIILGREGDDDLRGEGGDDYISGDAGNDEINDGFGSDKIRAGPGDDIIQLEGTGEHNDETGGIDEAHGDKGKDKIRSFGDGRSGFRVIFGGDDDDSISASGGDKGKIYGGSGDDQIDTCCDSQFDVWGGSGNDDIGGSSECALVHAFGGSGNDRISSPDEFSSGGSGNDIITFADCGGVAYGDSGDDVIRGGEQQVELHGGSGDDELVGGFDISDDELFGGRGDDVLTGLEGADYFDCGRGIDTITDFNAAEGDTKTADCENFPNDITDSNDNSTTTEGYSIPSDQIGQDFRIVEEDEASDPSSAAAMTDTSAITGNYNVEIELQRAADKQEEAHLIS
jgi:Ca2+-binding RTX toxin-like protein